MEIVIIEDEKLTAKDLAAIIKEVAPNAEIISFISSVKSGINYFQNNPSPDLIFSDIQLGDGLSFEIFKVVKILTPVIFCTAYDEYALNAFKTNSIDYILKPITTDSVKEALAKYNKIQQTFSNNDSQYNAILEVLQNKEKQVSNSILVHYKDKIIPILMDDVAIFYIENEITYLHTFEKKKYSINKKLEAIELSSGPNFFRINRQCILNRKTIIDVSQFFGRKLLLNISVPYDEKLIVSKAKAPSFLDWLEFSK